MRSRTRQKGYQRGGERAAGGQAEHSRQAGLVAPDRAAARNALISAARKIGYALAWPFSPALVAVRRGMSHGELSVADVMTPVADWASVDAANLPRARVGDIVATFRATAQRYLIVVERDAQGVPTIRGVFSANRVERALGHAIEEELRSATFSALAAALA